MRFVTFLLKVGKSPYELGCLKLKSNGNSKILQNLVLVSQIGISMLVPILGGGLLGTFIDKKIGTEILFFIIFIILGIISAFVTLFKITVGSNKRK